MLFHILLKYVTLVGLPMLSCSQIPLLHVLNSILPALFGGVAEMWVKLAVTQKS